MKTNTKNQVFILAIIVICFFSTQANATMVGELVLVDYYGYAFLNESIFQGGVVKVIDPGAEFIAQAPSGGTNLFSIDISDETITITGVNNYSNNYCLEFEWKFVVDSSSSIAFDSAELVSSSLFSTPPFTFPVNPDVNFDSATNTIVVSRFIDAGTGTAVVNEDGQAIIKFTTIPEPLTIALMGLGGLMLRRRK